MKNTSENFIAKYEHFKSKPNIEHALILLLAKFTRIESVKSTINLHSYKSLLTYPYRVSIGDVDYANIWLFQV